MMTTRSKIARLSLAAERGVVVVVALLLAACGGSGGGGPTGATPATPVAGSLKVSFVTPSTDDGAVLIQVSGPDTVGTITPAITPTSAGVIAYARASGPGFKVAAFGDITSGTLLTFPVPDIAKAEHYTAVVIDAADRANAQRGSLTGYSAAVTR